MLPPDLVTPKAAARALHVSASTVRRWVNQGKLKGYRIGSSRLFVRLSDVEALVVPVEPTEPIQLPRSEGERASAARAATERLRERGYGRSA